MKNVLIFVLGAGRYAVELRWVREIFTLGQLTPVPGAPPLVAGVVSFRGTIVPVLAGAPLLEAGNCKAEGDPRRPQEGDALVLVDVDGTRAALAVERIDAVTTLAPSADGLIDPRGKVLPLYDLGAMVQTARRLVEAAHAA
jgi:purine-binding chemotaxis protein CheW